MAIGGTKGLRLRQGRLWCVAAGLLAAFLVSPRAADSASQGTAPEKQPLSASRPVSPNSLEDGIRSLREQIARTPDDALLQVRLGYLLLDAGATAEAKAAFDEALKRNRHSPAAMTGEGIVLARTGNLKEAEEMLKAALAGNPNPVRTHYELGLVYERSGAPETALAEYKEGIAKFRQGKR